MAFAEVLNAEARDLAALGVDVIQFDEPAFNVYLDEVVTWGVEALQRAAAGLPCRTAVHICYGYGIPANIEWKQGLGREWRQYERIFPALAASRIDQVSLECANSHVPIELLGLLAGKDVLVGAIDVASDEAETPEQVALTIERRCVMCRRSGCFHARIAAWRRSTVRWRTRSSPHSRPAPRSYADAQPPRPKPGRDSTIRGSPHLSPKEVGSAFLCGGSAGRRRTQRSSRSGEREFNPLAICSRVRQRKLGVRCLPVFRSIVIAGASALVLWLAGCSNLAAARGCRRAGEPAGRDRLQRRQDRQGGARRAGSATAPGVPRALQGASAGPRVAHRHRRTVSVVIWEAAANGLFGNSLADFSPRRGRASGFETSPPPAQGEASRANLIAPLGTNITPRPVRVRSISARLSPLRPVRTPLSRPATAPPRATAGSPSWPAMPDRPAAPER